MVEILVDELHMHGKIEFKHPSIEGHNVSDLFEEASVNEVTFIAFEVVDKSSESNTDTDNLAYKNAETIKLRSKFDTRKREGDRHLDPSQDRHLDPSQDRHLDLKDRHKTPRKGDRHLDPSQ